MIDDRFQSFDVLYDVKRLGDSYVGTCMYSKKSQIFIDIADYIPTGHRFMNTVVYVRNPKAKEYDDHIKKMRQA